eukprot:1188041-Prorocentrum_minimum.AAC.10
MRRAFEARNTFYVGRVQQVQRQSGAFVAQVFVLHYGGHVVDEHGTRGSERFGAGAEPELVLHEPHFFFNNKPTNTMNLNKTHAFENDHANVRAQK